MLPVAPVTTITIVPPMARLITSDRARAQADGRAPASSAGTGCCRWSWAAVARPPAGDRQLIWRAADGGTLVRGFGTVLRTTVTGQVEGQATEPFPRRGSPAADARP